MTHYRHKKRGTEYVLIGFGKMQAEHWVVRVPPPHSVNTPTEYHVDMHEVAIYRSVDDGSWWVRPREEFEDGRFEALAAPPVEAKPDKGVGKDAVEEIAKIIDPHAFLPIKEEHEWAQDMVQQSQSLAISKATRIIEALSTLEPTAPQEMKEEDRKLVKELRSVVPYEGRQTIAFLCHHAADRIEAFSKEEADSGHYVDFRDHDALRERLLAAKQQLAEATEALRPFADAVFNDNGDMTVNYSTVTYDQFVAAYFAHKRITGGAK